MFNKERLEERQKVRAEIAECNPTSPTSTFLLISEALDDYIELKIQSDKVQEGILKDIQGGVAKITDSIVDVRCWMQEE